MVQQLDAALDDASRIRRFSVFIVTSILFCLALVSFAVRIAVKLHRWPFSLDDLFILFGLVLLIVSTGVFYAKLDQFYLGIALEKDASLANVTPANQIKDLHSVDLNATAIAISIMLWVATSSVKLAFLTGFRPVVQEVKGLKKYWVSAVVAVVILCGYWIAASVMLGVNNATSPPWFENAQLLYLALTYSGTALDILSYLTIIYILVIIGSQETTLFRQKLAPRAFLSLLLLIAIVSVFRNISFRGSTPIWKDSVWQIFWYYLSTALVIIVTSLTTFRPMFGPDQEGTTQPRDFIPDPCLPAKPSPTLSSFREMIWWKDGEEKDIGIVELRGHSRSTSASSSYSSVKKSMISEPAFVGGTSDWVENPKADDGDRMV